MYKYLRAMSTSWFLVAFRSGHWWRLCCTARKKQPRWYRQTTSSPARAPRSSPRRQRPCPTSEYQWTHWSLRPQSTLWCACTRNHSMGCPGSGGSTETGQTQVRNVSRATLSIYFAEESLQGTRRWAYLMPWRELDSCRQTRTRILRNRAPHHPPYARTVWTQATLLDRCLQLWNGSTTKNRMITTRSCSRSTKSMRQLRRSHSRLVRLSRARLTPQRCRSQAPRTTTTVSCNRLSRLPQHPARLSTTHAE